MVQTVLKETMEKQPGKRLWKYLASVLSHSLTLLWAGGMLAMVIASLMPYAGLSEMDSGFGRDKLARVVTFCLLSFYPAAFFPSFRTGLLVSTFVAPLGFFLEVLQKYVPGRIFSPGDMIANNAGAILGILLALTIRFFFRTGRFGSWPRQPSPQGHRRPPSVGEEGMAPVVPLPRGKPKRKWPSRLVLGGLLVLLAYIAWILYEDGFLPLSDFWTETRPARP